MSQLVLANLANKYSVSIQIIKSWFTWWFFHDETSAEKFIEENIDIIKAKPFVKWVGGKRQLISQFESLYPQQFNNYFEPFLWGWAVFFNIQRKKSFLSDVNEELINLYQVIKNKPKDLIKLLE